MRYHTELVNVEHKTFMLKIFNSVFSKPTKDTILGAYGDTITDFEVRGIVVNNCQFYECINGMCYTKLRIT